MKKTLLLFAVLICCITFSVKAQSPYAVGDTMYVGGIWYKVTDAVNRYVEVTNDNKGDTLWTEATNKYSAAVNIPEIVLNNANAEIYLVNAIGENSFYKCIDLNTVIIGNSVKVIGKAAFYRCSALTSVIISNSVTSIGEVAFCRCTALTSIIIPNSVTSIGEDAFYRSALVSVIIDNSVTTIGDGAFAFTALTSVTIPETVTAIGCFAFFECSNLETINFNATNCIYNGGAISSAMFSGNLLSTLNIGENVQTIPGDAFSQCYTLTSIINNAVIPQQIIDIDWQFPFYAALTDIPVYVPCGSLSAYQNSGWGEFFTNIIPMADSVIINDTILFDESYTQNGFNIANVVADTICYNVLQNANGCDSIITLNLIVLPSTNSVQTINTPKLRIFPNPATDYITVETQLITSLQGETVTITDLSGRTVAVETANAESKINVSALSAGIYLVRVGDRVEKLIKK
jgi:hypothetical protein